MRFTRQDASIFSAAFATEDDAAVITPPSYGTNKKKETDASAEEWIQASFIMRDKPSLMTPKVLLLALQSRPPVHVIRFLLSVNPKAASIPKTGPTPLQVAVQHNASLDVLETLLEFCPFALCVTNPQNPVDPLSYAKRHRKNETEVIELLSRPLSYWVTERSRDPNTSMTSFYSREVEETRSPPPQPSIDRQELYNVKLLCAQVLKGHKKLAKEVATFKELQTRYNKDEILKELQEQQRSQFYRQLIALDMKEKAMRAYVDKMEKQCMDHVDSRVDCWKKGMESWKSSTESKMQEWKILLEKEVKVNAHFRNDLTHWMEEQMLFRDELTHWMEEQVQKSVQTPFMFATNLGEMNEETPLCPDKKNDFVGDADRVKKRPWKPFFRHWDRIMLQDDK